MKSPGLPQDPDSWGSPALCVLQLYHLGATETCHSWAWTQEGQDPGMPEDACAPESSGPSAQLTWPGPWSAHKGLCKSMYTDAKSSLGLVWVPG